LVDQAVEQLRQAVTQGDWPIGQRIPPETALAGQLGVGRNTVREAVRALSHSGLLEVRQGDGTYVRATSEVSAAVRRLCSSELREVLQVRWTLEVEGARLAASSRTEEELARLTALLDERDRAQRETRFEDFVRTDAEFHLAVVHCGRNTLLAELYHGLTEVVTASVAASTNTNFGHAEEIEHRGLLQAIADKDPVRAVTEAGGFLNELLAHLDVDPAELG
jgi:DNA-binding FadR family transcriptional regulator